MLGGEGGGAEEGVGCLMRGLGVGEGVGEVGGLELSEEEGGGQEDFGGEVQGAVGGGGEGDPVVGDGVGSVDVVVNQVDEALAGDDEKGVLC